MIKKVKGFTLVAAVFILIILGLLSAFIIGISATTRTTATSAIAGANSYFAAYSGLEWGINRTLALVSCPSTTNLSLTQGSLSGYTVNVSCTQESFTENPLTITIHTLTSKATTGTIGSKDYSSREMKITIISGI